MSDAFNAAKEITIAALGYDGDNCTHAYPNKGLGSDVADFFEQVYTRLKKIEDDEINEPL